MWIIPFLAAVGVTAASSVDDLRIDLDDIFPGAANWFVHWGTEQATLDKISRLVDDDVPSAQWNEVMPPHTLLQPPIIAYAILSQYPEISIEQFRPKLAQLCERNNIQHDIRSIDNVYNSAMQYTRIPVVVHEAMKIMRQREDFSLNGSVDQIMREVNAERNLVTRIVGEGISKKRADLRLRTILTFWFLFCVKDNSAVYQSDDSMFATTETKFAIFEHMLLVVLRKRSSTGRML